VTAKNTPAGNSSVTYDATGNVTKYTDASGSVSYTYDANNNVVDVVEPGGTKTGCGTLGTLCTLFGYDKGNRTTSVKYPNGVTVAIGYNTPGQETSVTATRGSTVLVSQSYTYVNGTNNVGLRQTVADQAGRSPSRLSRTLPTGYHVAVPGSHAGGLPRRIRCSTCSVRR
jgi:YD repeat-containing protein